MYNALSATFNNSIQRIGLPPWRDMFPVRQPFSSQHATYNSCLLYDVLLTEYSSKILTYNLTTSQVYFVNYSTVHLDQYTLSAL